MGRNHRITDWNPDDAVAWDAGNNEIARRNLFCTVAGDHVRFSIWTLWSVMELFMPASRAIARLGLSEPTSPSRTWFQIAVRPSCWSGHGHRAPMSRDCQ